MKATRHFSVLCLLAIAAAATAQAGASGQPRIALSVDVKEEISAPDAQGRIQVVHKDVERAQPGDVLVYTLTYTNTGSEPAVNARVDDPIPPGTTLLTSSLQGRSARVTVSADGGKTFEAFPITRTVSGADGKPATEEIAAEGYTHLRWTAEGAIAPGETRTASFKVIVR